MIKRFKPKGLKINLPIRNTKQINLKTSPILVINKIISLSIK